MKIVCKFQGPNYLYNFWLDVFQVIREAGGSVMITNASSGRTKDFTQLNADEFSPDMLIEMLKTLQRCGIIERFNFQDVFLLEKFPWEHRWIADEKLPQDTTIYTYGQKVALHFWDQSMVVVVTNEEASDEERRLFENLWPNAQVLGN